MKTLLTLLFILPFFVFSQKSVIGNPYNLNGLEIAQFDFTEPMTYDEAVKACSNGLTRCICDFLNYSDHQAERINTMGVARTKRATCGKIVGVTWTKSTSTPGSADISATIYGKSVKIEVKIGKDRMSEAQKRYQENIERAGGIYYVAKDFDSFVEWYDIFSQNYKN